MLARIQQLIALGLAAAAAVAFVLGQQSGRLWLGFAFVALVVGSYAGVLAIEFYLLHRSYDAADRERPRIAKLARAWLREVLVAPRVFLWQQPFRSDSEPDHLPDARARRQRGVLLVHGFFCNRGLWNPWLRRLRVADIPVVAVSLEPVFGSIDDYAGTIADAAAKLERATGLTPVVVGHSMGGLALRAWMRRGSPARVHRLIAIGSPHRGTRLAGTGRGVNVSQMRHGSAWLDELGRSEAAGPRDDVVCFWSRCDNIVFPTRSATLPGADNRELDGTPHVAMVFHPEVFEEVERAVRPEPPRSTASKPQR
jgi:triacylglycerol lipase